MDILIRVIRQGIRSLLKRPGFAAIAIITLGLGIGANTTMFSVINALILSPPLIAEPDRVVAVWRTTKDRRIEGYVSYLDLQDWRTRNQSFEDIAGYKPQGFIMLESQGAERIQGMRVTSNFFPLLKTAPFLGRNFGAEEEKIGAQPVAIISHEFWQSRFGSDETALNKLLTLNGKPHIIIGILPPGFQFPLSVRDPLVWTTVSAEDSNLTERGAQILRAVGRLQQGVTLGRAQADIATVAASLELEYPQTNQDITAFIVGAHEQIVGTDARRALWLLLGAVGFILLIACVNMANLLLVQGSNRQKEIAIRAALGAGRWSIARELLTESILLSLLAGAAGLFIAVWGLSAIKYYAADQLPRLEEVSINVGTLIFTFVVSIVAGLLFTLVPTLRASRPEVNEILKAGTKAATHTPGMRVWRDSLVVVEVALSLVLLVGAGLMIRSLAQVVNIPPGFDPKNVLTGQVSLTGEIYEKPEECVRYINQTLERLKALPGVQSVAFVAPMPFSGNNVSSDFRIEGRPEPEPGQEPVAGNRSVTPEYFSAMKINLIKGRHFNEHDQRGGTGAAIINQALARRYFADVDPIGKRISHIGANQNEGDPEVWEIVGVVGDVHHNSLTKPATPEIYLPYQQNSWTWGNFLLRTSGEPDTLAAAFREQVRAVDKTVPITKIQPLIEAISRTVAESRFYTFLFSLFGALGLLLTVIGVYGVIAYNVAQRTREIGIRMALGATRHNILSMVLKQAGALAMLGAVFGIVLSFVLTRVVSSLLFEVKPTDPVTFAVATLVLLFSALLAGYAPAYRATRVDPVTALRNE